jgi:hypothetical protein
MSHTSFSFNFLFVEFFLVILARYLSVHSLSFFINLMKSENSNEGPIKAEGK